METVLIYTEDVESELKLTSLAKERSVKYKSCSDLGVLTEWLTLRPFSILLLPSTVPKDNLRDLSHLLWQKSPDAYCAVYNWDNEKSLDITQAKLSGLTLFQGEDLLIELGDFFERIRDARVKKTDGFNIMVVEDLDSPREIICVFVESLGYSSVEGKSSAGEALKALENNPEKYSCIITDIQMPKINGIEFIDIVRHHDKLKHLPVVVLTAYGNTDVLIDSLQAGASGFLVKPPKKTDLMRELSRASRISSGKESPRLASHNEAEHIRRIIDEQNLV